MVSAVNLRPDIHRFPRHEDEKLAAVLLKMMGMMMVMMMMIVMTKMVRAGRQSQEWADLPIREISIILVSLPPLCYPLTSTSVSTSTSRTTSRTRTILGTFFYCSPDMRFVKKITRPDFWANNFT